jgi:hypothetical protein
MTTLRPSLLRVLATGLAALGVLLAAVPLPASADDVTWSVRTASNQFGSNRTSFSYAVDPGGSVKDGLVVANRSTQPLELGIYAADGYTTDAGQLDLLTADKASSGIGAWVRTDAATVTIAPGKEQSVGFSISVPANASPGDYVGGVVTTLSSATASGISVDRRLGIRIALRVGGELAPALGVEGVGVAFSGGWNPFAAGDADVTFTLHNTGNAVLSAQPSATVSGPFGWFATSATAADAPPALLPGESWTQTVHVPAVAATFVVFARATVVPLVVDASGSTTPLEAASGSASGAAIPWTALLLVVLAACVVAAVVVLRRRAKARAEARVQEAVRTALASAGVPSPDVPPEDVPSDKG